MYNVGSPIKEGEIRLEVDKVNLWPNVLSQPFLGKELVDELPFEKLYKSLCYLCLKIFYL